jgi:hypothetical protein
MYESIYKNNEVENEVSLDMSYFWYSDNISGSVVQQRVHSHHETVNRRFKQCSC